MPNNGIGFEIGFEALRPLIEATVAATLAKLDQAQAQAGDKIAFDETEAARMIGVAPHVLRDARLRGEIRASQIMRRRVRYTKNDLMEYLLSHPWTRNRE